MTTRVKCCVRQTLTGSPPPPPLPHPPPFPLFSLFSPLCRGPKPAKHISKWQLLRLSSKKPRLVDFPRLMWHLWPRNRVEGERWGPMAQWWFVWGGGTAGKGSRIRMREDISSQQIDTGPLIPGFFFPSSWTWSALQMAVLSHWPFFWSQKRLRGEVGLSRWGRSGVPTTHRPSRLHKLTPLPEKKKKKNPPLHSSSPSPSPCPRIPPQLPLQSPRTSLHYWGKHNRLIVLQRGGLDNSAAPRCIVSPNKPHKV